MGDYCTFACLGPYKFHTFLLRLLLSPPLTAKCAQLHGGCGVLGWVLGGFSPLSAPLYSWFAFSAALQGTGKLWGEEHKGGEQKLGFSFASFSSSRASSGALVASAWDSSEGPPFPPRTTSRTTHSCSRDAVTLPLCSNRLPSVSLIAGKRVFYVAFAGVRLMRRRECSLLYRHRRWEEMIPLQLSGQGP